MVIFFKNFFFTLIIITHRNHCFCLCFLFSSTLQIFSCPFRFHTDGTCSSGALAWDVCGRQSCEGRAMLPAELGHRTGFSLGVKMGKLWFASWFFLACFSSRSSLWIPPHKHQRRTVWLKINQSEDWLRGVLRKPICPKLDSSFLFCAVPGVSFWSCSLCLWTQNMFSANHSTSWQTAWNWILK